MIFCVFLERASNPLLCCSEERSWGTLTQDTLVHRSFGQKLRSALAIGGSLTTPSADSRKRQDGPHHATIKLGLIKWEAPPFKLSWLGLRMGGKQFKLKSRKLIHGKKWPFCEKNSIASPRRHQVSKDKNWLSIQTLEEVSSHFRDSFSLSMASLLFKYALKEEREGEKEKRRKDPLRDQGRKGK